MKKKKNIAILTQPLKSNYGGIIQNYALQKILKDHNLDVTTIDRDYIAYSPFKLKINYYKRCFYRFIKNEKKFIFSPKDLEVVISNSTNFINNNINRTKKIRSTEELKNYFNSNKYDTVIVGSDQVWRPMYSPNIYNYFLDILQDNKNIKKLTYAASFGTDNWEFTEEQTIKCRELAKEFDVITVREKSGLNLVNNYLQQDAKFVLDPTLLLKKEDYISLIQKSNTEKNSGIYTYVLDKSHEKLDIIKSVQKLVNKDFFYCQPKNSTTNPTSFNLRNYMFPKVEQWLRGFYDADFVITDSFHGTVFSIIFNKPFVAIINKERGASRFESLLGELGLQDRLIDRYDKEKISKISSTTIDYSEVNNKLEQLREMSIKLLISNL